MGTLPKADEPGRRRAVVFGTAQERKLLPAHYPPDHLGNQMRREGQPHRGPGCYDNHEVGMGVVC